MTAGDMIPLPTTMKEDMTLPVSGRPFSEQALAGYQEIPPTRLKEE